ncbi:hypothetical protein L9F63_005702, partial [Diploptera punctata]
GHDGRALEAKRRIFQSSTDGVSSLPLMDLVYKCRLNSLQQDSQAICSYCHYTCQTCSGSNDYECTSCYGDAILKETSKSERIYCECNCSSVDTHLFSVPESCYGLTDCVSPNMPVSRKPFSHKLAASEDFSIPPFFTFLSHLSNIVAFLVFWEFCYKALPGEMSDLEDFDHVFGICGEEEFDRVYQRIQLEEQENR